MEGAVTGWSDPSNISDSDLTGLCTDSAPFVADPQAIGVTDRQEYETRIDYLGATKAAMETRGFARPAADTDYTATLMNVRTG